MMGAGLIGFGVVFGLGAGAVVASGLYALVLSLVAKDASVYHALEAGRWLAAWSDWTMNGAAAKRSLAAAIGGFGGLAVFVGAMVVVFAPRGGKGARFQDGMALQRGGYFRANSMFVGRFGGLSFEWKSWRREAATGMKESQTARKLIGGRYVHMPDFGHALVSGPTRSGKGASLIIPNALEFRGSMVILDIRGETFDRTAGYRATFSKVIKLAPSNMVSHCYNPLDFVRRTPGLFESDIMAIASGIVGVGAGSTDYWPKDAVEVVAGVIGYVLEAPNLKDRSLCAVMDVLIGREAAQTALKDVVAGGEGILSDFTMSKLVPFAVMAEKQWNGVYGMVRTALSPFNNEVTRRVLSRSSFDLFAIRKTPHSVYVDFRLSQLRAMGGLCNVLVTQMMNYLTDDLRGKGEHRVMFMLDEFTTLGEIGPLMGLLKVGAGNGISVWAFVQSMTNVREIYKDTGLDNFLDNIEAFVFLGGSSQSVLDHVERRLGKKVVVQRVRRDQPGRGVVGAVSVERREVEKSLMTGDELSQLDRREAIILPRGAGPIRLWRNYWFGDREFVKRAAVKLAADAIPDLSKGLPAAFGQASLPAARGAGAVAVARATKALGALPAATARPAALNADAVRLGGVFLSDPAVMASRAAFVKRDLTPPPSEAKSGAAIPAVAGSSAPAVPPPADAVADVAREGKKPAEASLGSLQDAGLEDALVEAGAAAALYQDYYAEAERELEGGGGTIEACEVEGADVARAPLAPRPRRRIEARSAPKAAEASAVAPAELCLRPLSSIWSARTAKKLSELVAGALLGDLLASSAAAADYAEFGGKLRATVRAKLGGLGCLGAKPAEWPAPGAKTSGEVRKEIAAALTVAELAVTTVQPAVTTERAKRAFAARAREATRALAAARGAAAAHEASSEWSLLNFLKSPGKEDVAA